MLRRVTASRIENCWTPSLPAGTRRSPTSSGPPKARGAQVPKAAAPAAPAATPRKLLRLMLCSLPICSPAAPLRAGACVAVLLDVYCGFAGAVNSTQLRFPKLVAGPPGGLLEHQVDPSTSAHRAGERALLAGERVVRPGRGQRARRGDGAGDRIQAHLDQAARRARRRVVGNRKLSPVAFATSNRLFSAIQSPGSRLLRCWPPPASAVFAIAVPLCSWANSTSWRRSCTTCCLTVVSGGWPLAPL